MVEEILVWRTIQTPLSRFRWLYLKGPAYHLNDYPYGVIARSPIAI